MIRMPGRPESAPLKSSCATDGAGVITALLVWNPQARVRMGFTHSLQLEGLSPLRKKLSLSRHPLYSIYTLLQIWMQHFFLGQCLLSSHSYWVVESWESYNILALKPLWRFFISL